MTGAQTKYVSDDYKIVKYMIEDQLNTQKYTSRMVMTWKCDQQDLTQLLFEFFYGLF